MEGLRGRYLELYEDMPKYFYLMAVEKLKDKDRPRFVRDYFEV